MRFNIEGEPMPVVVCELESGEMMITEKGAMSWMSPNMQMNTVGGGIGKIFGSKIIFIESFANSSSKSITGKIVYKFADLFIVQWENMLNIYPKSVYGGWIY